MTTTNTYTWCHACDMGLDHESCEQHSTTWCMDCHDWRPHDPNPHCSHDRARHECEWCGSDMTDGPGGAHMTWCPRP